METKRKFGWIPDLPDVRDYKFKALPPEKIKIPTVVNMIPQCPLVYNQGQLGSCTAQATAGVLQFDSMKQKILDTTVPSRLFIYYNTRVLEGTCNEDSGASIRNAIKAVVNNGACDEIPYWPYDISKFTIKPPDVCYQKAGRKAIVYQRIDNTNLQALLTCLTLGYPIVFGMTVYESFENVGINGFVPMPSRNEKALGGHAMDIVGFNTRIKRFMVRNSWGSDFGDRGYLYIPFLYLINTNLADDFWTIRKISG